MATASDSPAGSNLRGALLLAPMVLFLALVFLYPIAGMLGLSVRDGDLATVMPGTVTAIGGWDGTGLPDETVFAAAAADLKAAAESRTVGTAGRRLGYEAAAYRKVVTDTARALRSARDADGTWQARMTALNPAWGEPGIWTAIRNSRGPLSDFFLLQAVDLRRDAQGAIAPANDENRLYVTVLARTFSTAAVVTILAILLALPAAYLLASSRASVSRLLMIALLLPLWTSILVRSAAWTILLQQNGLVNAVLMKTGLIGTPLSLIYNRTGVVIALTHVLLPYAVLPILAAMRNVPATQTLASSSLGAGPGRTFLQVYLPQIVSGISAGGILVFILSLGYYVTPLLLGGPKDQLLPYYIAYHTSQTANWGLAAALGAILLVATLILYGAYVRLVGADRIGLG